MNHNLVIGMATIVLLVISNVLMTFAWYGHLKLQQMDISTNWPLWLVIIASWAIALLEYCFMIPANRIGFVDNGGPYTLMQLIVVQEAISLTVFTAIVVTIFKGEHLHWNHFVAFALLILAVYFAFMKVD